MVFLTNFAVLYVSCILRRQWLRHFFNFAPLQRKWLLSLTILRRRILADEARSRADV